MSVSFYPTENSTETICDFASSDSNNVMMDKIATKLDQKSRVVGYWIDLGHKFNIPGDKLKEIEYGQFNPTLALMEYLYSTQDDLTVRKFYDEAKKSIKRVRVSKKLECFLDGKFDSTCIYFKKINGTLVLSESHSIILSQNLGETASLFSLFSTSETLA